MLDKVVEPLRADTLIAVRPRSALGLKYVELTPGPKGKKLAAGATITIRNSREGLELEDVYSTLDEKTRDNARAATQGFGDAFAGRGQSINTTADIPGLVDDALAAALGPPGGPAFLDFPLDYVFMEAEVDADTPPAAPRPGSLAAADGDQIERAAELLRAAERPVIMAGTGLYWGHGEHAVVSLAEELRIPVFVNGLGRGCIPADHELAFSRARGKGLKEADVALVIGVPMDFRLGFGACTTDVEAAGTRSECRWTSGSGSAARSATTPRWWRWARRRRSARTRARCARS